VCVEVNTVLRAVAADFFFNCWYLEISSNNLIRHVPKSVLYHAQGLRLETSQNLYVGSGNRTPAMLKLEGHGFESLRSLNFFFQFT
jgi:hypothetical protein